MRGLSAPLLSKRLRAGSNLHAKAAKTGEDVVFRFSKPSCKIKHEQFHTYHLNTGASGSASKRSRDHLHKPCHHRQHHQNSDYTAPYQFHSVSMPCPRYTDHRTQSYHHRASNRHLLASGHSGTGGSAGFGRRTFGSASEPGGKSGKGDLLRSLVQSKQQNTHDFAMKQYMEGLKKLEAEQGNFAECEEENGEEREEEVEFEHDFEGRVESIGVGCAEVSGVRTAKTGSILRFQSGLEGMVLHMRNKIVDVMLMDHVGRGNIRTGDAVVDTGDVVQFPVQDAVCGNVYNPRGVPLKINSEALECKPSTKGYPLLNHKIPSLIARSPIDTMIYTGIGLFDFFHPIGRGSRIAIEGPSNSGKCDMAMNIICNLRDYNEKCAVEDDKLYAIYVVVGKPKRHMQRVYATLSKHGALAYTTIIAAPSGDPLPLQYLAPFAGSQLASHYRERGRHVLVIYDDLRDHQRVYQMLPRYHLQATAGLDHARILEACAQMSSSRGGGSVTGICLLNSETTDNINFLNVESRHSDLIKSYVDSTIVIDPNMTMYGLWPPLDCSTFVGRPPLRFQPKLLLHFRSRLNELLRQSELTAKQYDWAKQFGIEPEEEDDTKVLEYREKLQDLLQQDAHTHMNMAQLLLVLQSCCYQDVVEVLSFSELDCMKKELFLFAQEEFPKLYEALLHLSPNESFPEELRVELETCCQVFFTRRFPDYVLVFG